MTYFPVQSPYPIFTDDDGTPLESGYIYIGEANQNPVTNPITAYWDDAFLYPAALPIRTIAGYPDRNGSPSNIYINIGVNPDYSILILDKKESRVFYKPLNVSGAVEGVNNQIDFLNDLRSIEGYGQTVYVRGYDEIGDGGEGHFEWHSGVIAGTYDDNDGTVIVPTGGDGSGAWLRKYPGPVSVKWFGAKGDGTTDDSETIANAAWSLYLQRDKYLATYSMSVLSFPQGIYRITREIELAEQQHIEGQHAVINIDYDGYAFFTQGHKFYCRDMIFEGGKGAFRVQTYNVNTAMAKWEYCQFRHYTEFGINYEDTAASGGSNSTTCKISFCSFIAGQYILRSTADYTEVADSWIQPSAGLDTSGSFKLIRGRLVLRRNVCVPGREDANGFYRWVDISNGVGAMLVAENMRFGGEDGGWCVAVSDAYQSGTVPTGIIIKDSECYSVTPIGTDAATLVYLNQLPNKVILNNCFGFTSSNAKSVVRLDSAIDPASATWRGLIANGSINMHIIDVPKINTLEAKTIACLNEPGQYKQFYGPNYKFGKELTVTSGSTIDLEQVLGIFSATPDAHERGVIYLEIMAVTTPTTGVFATYIGKFAIPIGRGTGNIASTITNIYNSVATFSAITFTVTPAIDITDQTISLTISNSLAYDMNVMYKLSGWMTDSAFNVLQEIRFVV